MVQLAGESPHSHTQLGFLFQGVVLAGLGCILTFSGLEKSTFESVSMDMIIGIPAFFGGAALAASALPNN